MEAKRLINIEKIDRILDFEEKHPYLSKIRDLGRSISWKFRRFFFRLKRLWQFHQIAWDDEDFDFAYILYIMEFKLQHLREEISRHKRHVHWEKDVNEIRFAELLLKRIIDPPYHDMNSKNCKCPPIDERLFNNAPFCDHCRYFGIRHISQMEKRDWELFWSHISKNAQKWWD